MNIDQNKFDSYVTRSILANNVFEIKEVKNLRSIKSMYFDFDEYPKVETLIVNKNFHSIEDSSTQKTIPREYLEIM